MLPIQPPTTVYLNGQFISSDKAMISHEDRGFYFADGIYEVVKYYRGKPLCFNEHLQRLKNSLEGVRIRYNRFNELRGIFDQLVETNKLEQAYAGIYLQITRGAAPRIHCFPGTEVEPTVYARAFPMKTFLEEMKNGIRVISREDIRWHRCNIKSIALLPNTMLFQEATEAGAGECFLIRDGYFTEATHSNILFVKDGTLHTHPDSNLILPGITKGLVFDICRRVGIGVIEMQVPAAEIPQMDECFITGTGSEIMPVIAIDEMQVGNGKPGAITRRLQNEFFRISYLELAGERIVTGDW